MPKRFIWQFSKKYIAGETMDDAIKTSQLLNSAGFSVTIDLLGELISDEKQVENTKQRYFSIIKILNKYRINGTVSLKPTSFGLLQDFEKCYQNIRDVVLKAVHHGNFVRLDMEDSSCTSLEVELYKRLVLEFPSSVGIVLQAYLKRTKEDLELIKSFKTKSIPLNIRLCKGIYIESDKHAFQDFKAIRQNYLMLLEEMLKEGIFVGIATHDRYLVEKSYELLSAHNTPRNGYEFQMLYGVTPNLRDEIVANGHRMKIYVPFGADWFAYCTRRLKENPKMINDIMKAIFVRG